MNYTDTFLDNLERFSEKTIPEHVAVKVRQLILDYLGVTIAGAASTKDKTSAILNAAIDIEGVSPLIGLNKTVNIEKALLINGLNAHALDFDDGTNTGIIHLGSPIFTALLPLLRHKKIPVTEFLKAVVMGYETSFTMAITIQPEHKERGYHATGTCGTIGVAMAIAYLLKFNKRQKKDGFSAAALAASGSLKALEDGSDYKPYNVAKAALNGYYSSLLGYSGYRAPDDVLEGFQGFIKQMTGLDEVEIKAPLYLDTYAVEKAYIKPFAACRYCHPAIGAMIDIKNEYKLIPADVQKIVVRTYKWAVKKHDHTEIMGITSAKMSIPYSAAVAFIYGKAGMREFDNEIIQTQEVRELTKKVEVYEDETMTAAFPKVTTALCEVYTKNGNCYTKQVDFPKGEPENPLTEEEVEDKFRMLTRYAGMPEERIQQIIDICSDFEHRYMELFDVI
ncbi:MmgE/PrpD family protein [Clostridium sp. AM58-1XD]|uniref:MmgE/PrpD family protein n=1 Tax=Clostridium sp. AM58-1XD TaxID=2292307 RepID=UPI000E4FC765|nr:MmgE/PrpD family protein [Clostridium sp. AM58-1XD]RGY96745.1 MmgE/PrpD family protein [Clostridium sp. AM58-1XD]